MITTQTLTAVLSARTSASGHIFLTVLFLCYLIGAIPTSYLLAQKLMKLDLREHGTGNLGATNASRYLGPYFFFIILFLDAGKAVGALLLAQAFLPDIALVGQLWCAAMLLIGNAYSIFVNFHGGKGVSTSAGILSYFLPFHLLMVYLGVFVMGRVLARRVDVAVLAAVAVGGAWVQLTPGLAPALYHAVSILTGWIWLRHWRNLFHLLGYETLER